MAKSSGHPVQLFRPVAQADLIIATGNLELHRKAGYTGGDKALMPGVCSRESIQGNHRMMDQPGAKPGQITGNPIREDMEEAGRMAGLAFIVNAVLNSRQEMVKTVAGNRIRPTGELSMWTGCIEQFLAWRILQWPAAAAKDQAYTRPKDWKTPANWSGKGNHHPSKANAGNV